MVDAFLRVTWERPHPEGPNDWVEDPHVYIQDAIFEAAAFARDAYLKEIGMEEISELASERARAGAILRVLRWNGRLEEIVASLPPEEPSRSRRRRRKARASVDRKEAVLPPDLPRREFLLSYLEGMDRLTAKGVPLSNAIRLCVLFAPVLLAHLDRRLAANPEGRTAEEITDEILYPVARRHSLARRDRDRIKRCSIALRRLLTGQLKRKTRGIQRLIRREHFREAVVLLWLHCKATNSGWEEFRFWESRTKNLLRRQPASEVAAAATKKSGMRKRRRRRRGGRRKSS
jgi:hypothetical protein